MGKSFVYCMSRLTPKEGGAWQATCACPWHCERGKPACTRTCAVSERKMDAVTKLRCLKFWLLCARDCTSKAEHRMLWDSKVMVALRDGDLPTEEDLDDLEYASWHAARPFGADPAASAPGQGLSSAAGGSEAPVDAAAAPLGVPDALGGALPGVPSEVHQRMLQLLSSGGISATTPAQRARNPLTSKSEYGVPDGLREALRNSYIGPNLPPPLGMYWQCVHGSWRLRPMGG